MSDEQSSYLEHDEFCVSLNFRGDDIDPPEITRLIGCEPTSAARTGDLSARAGRSFTYPSGFWSLSTQRSTHDIEEQLAELFSRLTSDCDVWRSLTTRYSADLFCGVFLSWFGHGFSMSPALHRALTDRNLLITFDIYPEYDRNA
jgi:hypothetical protein